MREDFLFTYILVYLNIKISRIIHWHHRIKKIFTGLIAGGKRNTVEVFLQYFPDQFSAEKFTVIVNDTFMVERDVLCKVAFRKLRYLVAHCRISGFYMRNNNFSGRGVV